MNFLLIGSGAREHAIARAVKKSKIQASLYCFASSNNPGIAALSSAPLCIGTLTDIKAITDFAKQQSIDFAIIGPESPLGAGVADHLRKAGIQCIGPTQKLAQIETSKAFTKLLLQKYNIEGSTQFQIFDSLDSVEKFIHSLGGNYVIKADGLKGGKGVKVSGDHLQTTEDGLAYAQELVSEGSRFVIEEKLVGQEFSLMAFCDGAHLAFMPLVQDHKRAYRGDTGPNTGGMGCYSDANHLLPFLTEANAEDARAIMQKTISALTAEFQEPYKGILYGGFMLTKDGVKLIEFNARLGDPEAMVLELLESDFVALCEKIINGSLCQEDALFRKEAMVCKYAVPEGYPDNPVKNEKIDVSKVENPKRLFFAGVGQKKDGLYLTGSRAVAVLGSGNTIEEAEKIAEREIKNIDGPLFHREDIGTREFIEGKIEMMQRLRPHLQIK